MGALCMHLSPLVQLMIFLVVVEVAVALGAARKVPEQVMRLDQVCC